MAANCDNGRERTEHERTHEQGKRIRAEQEVADAGSPDQ